MMAKKKPKPQRLLSPGNPGETAHKMIADKYTAHGYPILQHWNGDFLVWASTCYVELEPARISSHVFHYLEKALKPGPKDEPPVAFSPMTKNISEVSGRLENIRHLGRTQMMPPCWLDDDKERLPPDEILACRNGLLHLPTKKLLRLDTQFFNINAVTYAYDLAAPAPGRWLEFLDQLWPGDPVAIACLQEIFGLMLTTDTSFQKLFLMIGPKRAGKGTIGRVLTGLVGKNNVVSPTLHSLGENFGRQSLIGKQTAIVSNFMIGRKTDETAIAENLLSISGEDFKTIQRKYKVDWHGRLGVRFFMEANLPPGFKDPSGALASRFILLHLTRSWFGKEDTELEGKLLAELPGILNWSIEGWDRLKERGHFVMPKSSRMMLRQLEDKSNPEAAFVRDHCVVELGAEVRRYDLYQAWLRWNHREGHKWTGDAGSFGTNLRASFPNIGDSSDKGADGSRYRTYVGIRLRTLDEGLEEEDEDDDDGPAPF